MSEMEGLALWKVVSPLIPSDSGDAGHAETIARLATLLNAGLAPVSAWRELAEHSTTAACSRVGELLDQGRNIHEAIAEVTAEESVAWRSVGACWSVARRSGSAIGPALLALAESLNDVASTKREIQVALASPLATIRLVMVLPVVAVLSSLLSGVGEAHTVFLTPLGLGVLVLGGVMMAVAWWWSKRLAESAKPSESAFSLELDLFAVACSGGALPEAARRTVEQVMTEYQLEPAPNEEVKNLQALSRRAGVPVIKLATAHATLLRRRMRTQAQEKVERLGVTLVMPLGLLVLPAFVLIAVVPMALGLWGGGISTT